MSDPLMSSGTFVQPMAACVGTSCIEGRVRLAWRLRRSRACPMRVTATTGVSGSVLRTSSSC